MSTLYEILHLIICFSLFYSKHNYFFEIYSICCPTPKLDVESSFGIMVNYLYHKDSFIVQGRAQRYEESGGTDIPYGTSIKNILMGES